MVRSPNVAVVSSRLPRRIEPDSAWIKGLRAVLRKIAPEQRGLLVGDQTAGSDLILRGASRCEIACEIVEPVAGTLDSPQDRSLRDQAVISQADLIYVLSLRSNGNIHRLVRDRLRGQATIVLIDIPDLQSEAARADLIECGAALWKPSATEMAPFTGPTEQSTFQRLPPDNVYQIAPLPNSSEWEYLIHTTRSCSGPWPGESFDDYADGLLDSRPDADHSAFGTLKRIVQQRRIIASNQSIRGGFSSVSLSACPLDELPSLRCFRPHRTRWDFEPYGICLSRSWLVERGVRPVVYGDEAGWQMLSDSDQAFFQLEKGESGIDWTVEREWRHSGDLDLSDVSSDDVLLFVPDYDAARSLSLTTDWPITLWPHSI